MKFTFDLTPDQLDALASLVAAKLGSALANQKATLSSAEAAQRAGVSPQTIRRRVEAGQIPRVPGLHNLRIPTAALDAWISQNTPSPD
jgi:excisionase family DNA binding protein